MQDPTMLLPEEGSVPKSRKRKVSTKKASTSQPLDNVKGFQELLPSLPSQTGKKASKKGMKNGVTPFFQHPVNSPTDSLQPDSSAPGNEYRVLRRKYLMLEEESFGLGSELTKVEDEVKALEEEKLALLDELVVLEGLVDPSEFQAQHQHLLA